MSNLAGINIEKSDLVTFVLVFCVICLWVRSLSPHHNNEVRGDDLSLFNSLDEPVRHSCVMIILAIISRLGFKRTQ